MQELDVAYFETFDIGSVTIELGSSVVIEVCIETRQKQRRKSTPKKETIFGIITSIFTNSDQSSCIEVTQLLPASDIEGLVWNQSRPELVETDISRLFDVKNVEVRKILLVSSENDFLQISENLMELTVPIEKFLVTQFYSTKARTLLDLSINQSDPHARERRAQFYSESSSSRSTNEPIEPASNNDLDLAISRIHTSYCPQGVPLCREQEFQTIHDHVENCIRRGGRSKPLYICGMTGTGKTLVVLSIISSLKRDVINGRLPPFDFIHLNGMELPDPNYIYPILLRFMTTPPLDSSSDMTGRQVRLSFGPSYEGKAISAQQAKLRLEALFQERKQSNNDDDVDDDKRGSNQPVHVVLLDEIDYLYTPSKSVLFNMFEWPTRFGSNLVIIGISNTHNLIDSLSARISSRLSSKKVVFPPYSFKDIQVIIDDRLKGLTARFEPKAIEFISRRIAATSGDIRKALDVCKRCLESSNNVLITITQARDMLQDHTAIIFASLLTQLTLIMSALLLSIDRCMKRIEPAASVNKVTVEQVWCDFCYVLEYHDRERKTNLKNNISQIYWLSKLRELVSYGLVEITSRGVVGDSSQLRHVLNEGELNLALSRHEILITIHQSPVS